MSAKPQTYVAASGCTRKIRHETLGLPFFEVAYFCEREIVDSADPHSRSKQSKQSDILERRINDPPKTESESLSPDSVVKKGAKIEFAKKYLKKRSAPASFIAAPATRGLVKVGSACRYHRPRGPFLLGLVPRPFIPVRARADRRLIDRPSRFTNPTTEKSSEEPREEEDRGKFRTGRAP